MYVVLCYEVMLADGADRAGEVEVGWRITLPGSGAETWGRERGGEGQTLGLGLVTS